LSSSSGPTTKFSGFHGGNCSGCDLSCDNLQSIQRITICWRNVLPPLPSILRQHVFPERPYLLSRLRLEFGRFDPSGSSLLSEPNTCQIKQLHFKQILKCLSRCYTGIGVLINLSKIPILLVDFNATYALLVAAIYVKYS
jgi:hypothetical protein